MGSLRFVDSNEQCGAMIDYNRITKQNQAYELTFVIENLLRVAMHNTMVAKLGPNYFTGDNFPQFTYKRLFGENEINIINIAKERKGHDRKYNLALGYDYPLLWYLDFGVLISVIHVFFDQYFIEMFTVPKNEVYRLIERLEGISPIRNAIAHNRYISDIDLGDLKSLSRVLTASLKEIMIKNFNLLTLNPIEELVDNLLSSLNEIKTAIVGKTFVPRTDIRNLASAYSAFISILDEDAAISEFEEIFGLLRQYNRLPRKPGKGNQIGSFCKDTEIFDKIEQFAKIIGGLR
jgi:hypothetical protein